MLFFNRLVAPVFKAIKYFVDSAVRDQVTPVPGSVLYCDLWMAAEHSGIYVADGQISNIVVDGFAESIICLSSARSFISKSTLGQKIYVSCDSHGAVGDATVARGAYHHVGERAFYGLVIKNCHHFSTKCVNYTDREADVPWWERLVSDGTYETWEPTLGILKSTARKKLNATKWRLWDWDQAGPTPEPDWQAHDDYFRHLPLDAEGIGRIRAELAAALEYDAEIADEALPEHVCRRLRTFRSTLSDITQQYEKARDFLAACPEAGLSYADLQGLDEDFSALAQALRDNRQIQQLAHKMGRHYVAEDRKRRTSVPAMSHSEIHGTHRSNDLMRMLPNELLNLEDETLEVLFYARLLENNLLSYQLQGTTMIDGEESESVGKRTGPVVACLDTSGSMQGAPLQKAKALLMAIANILRQENRSLHVLLFGAEGELREFSMEGKNDAVGLLRFLQQGFGGGTDFATPLQRAMDIIASQDDYLKADVLMVSDGDCKLSAEFSASLQSRKQNLHCMIYSVLCAGGHVADGFSDEVVVL